MKLFGALKGDKIIWAIVFGLFTISFLLIFSATSNLGSLVKHTIHLLTGFLIIKFSSNIPYKYFTNLSFIFFISSIVLLTWALLTPSYVLDDFNNPIDASRWISIFGFTFQPSELAKFSLILFLARNLSLKKEKNFTFQTAFLPIFFPIILVCSLTIKSNASTTLIIFFISSVILFISHFPIKTLFKFWGLSILVFCLLFIIIMLFSPQNRIGTWNNRMDNFLSGDSNWQLQQAHEKLDEVGPFGLGPGGSVYFTKGDSDLIYIFSILEYGLIMGILLLSLYLIFFQRIIAISRRIKLTFPHLLVWGLGILVVSQALIHMGVNYNLLPTTGQTLPLVSKGGTSVWIMSLSIGIILNISSLNYEK